MSVPQKKDLHALVDALPESEVVAAHRYLEFLQTVSDERRAAPLTARG